MSKKEARQETRRRRESQKKRQRYIAIGVIAIGIILIVGLLWWSNRPQPIELSNIQTETPPGADGIAWGGPEDAPVTIVEYADFDCSYCARHNEETVPQLVERYGDNPNVRYEFRPFVLHTETFDSAVGAMCAAEQNIFWPYHDTLYANFGADGVLEEAGLKTVAEAVGADMSAFNDCYDSGSERRTVNDLRAEAQREGIDSTPSFIINGELLVGARPASDFFQAIDAALAAESLG